MKRRDLIRLMPAKTDVYVGFGITVADARAALIAADQEIDALEVKCKKLKADYMELDADYEDLNNAYMQYVKENNDD